MKTLVLANQKGGVGKSAVATLLAHHLAQQGRRVLALDFDHQGNLSGPLQRSGRAQVASFGADQAMSAPPQGVPRAGLVLVPSDGGLLARERQPQQHNLFARQLRAFLAAMAAHFDVCLIDTNPNPDIRVIAALASADFVLSPIQLNQEAMEGVHGLLNHPRVGVHKIRALFNPRLQLVGLLPCMVETTPFQRANFVQIGQRYHALLVQMPGGGTASIPRRSAVAEAQAEGLVLWEMKKSAAREAWREIEPTLRALAGRLEPSVPTPSPAGPAHGAAA
jgi:chromosome partitioning protein